MCERVAKVFRFKVISNLTEDRISRAGMYALIVLSDHQSKTKQYCCLLLMYDNEKPTHPDI